METKIYRQLVDQAPDAILFADSEGLIRLWNEGAEATFGFSAMEALGQSLDLIIPDKLRERHWDGYHKVMESGATAYGSQLLSVPALHKNGHKLFSDFSIIMIKDENGKMQGVAAIMRDSTVQKEKEKKMRQRLEQLGEKS